MNVDPHFLEMRCPDYCVCLLFLLIGRFIYWILPGRVWHFVLVVVNSICFSWHDEAKGLTFFIFNTFNILVSTSTRHRCILFPITKPPVSRVKSIARWSQKIQKMDCKPQCATLKVMWRQHQWRFANVEFIFFFFYNPSFKCVFRMCWWCLDEQCLDNEMLWLFILPLLLRLC